MNTGQTLNSKGSQPDRNANHMEIRRIQTNFNKFLGVGWLKSVDVVSFP